VAGVTLAIANSSFSGNAAGAGGTGGRGGEGDTGGVGGIGENGGNAGGLSSSFNQMNLTNVTFANNSAGTGGQGGTGGPGPDTGGNGGNGGNGAPGGNGGAIHAIALEDSNSLIHGTLSGNAAGAAGPGGSGGKGGGGATGTSGPPGAGGDIFNILQTTGSPINVANTITVGGSGPACSPPPSLVNGGHNVFADSCLGPPGPNPLLGPLQNNGGSTQTMALGSGSPAIDLVPALAAQCQATDQRGVSRPAGAACDAGAYEVAPPSATTGPATGVDSSNVTLTGTVRPNSGDAAVHFEYGTTTAYGGQTGVQHLSGASDQAVSAALTGLSPSTTYHFRVIATAADGTATGGDQTFTTAASPPGTGGDGTSARAAASRLTLAPRRFRGASRGPATKPAKVSVGTTVSYRLNIGARVRFTVARLLPGRRARGGRCVKPTRQNRGARKCTRRVRVRGSFTRTGGAGPNRFRFMGRVGGRKLKPGDYRLLATPTANGVRGRATSARFRILPA
jgi:hypothetical protein